MDPFDQMDILGNAFSKGEVDALAPFLTENCEYVSQYARKSLTGAEAILSHMRDVFSRINDTCSYTYKIVELGSILWDGFTLDDLDAGEGISLCRYGLFLYQYGKTQPVAIVVCGMDPSERFRSICLSRDKTKFNVHFYGEEVEEDSPEDLPSTVSPRTAHDRWAEQMRNTLSGQRWDPAVTEADSVYIWRKADAYVNRWLPQKGYVISESQIFEDCIGYRCNRKGYAYTIFLYAYGKKKTVHLDGEFCGKLASLPFAEKSTILILYLNVDRYMDDAGVQYRIRNYSGDEVYEPELWQLRIVNGTYRLVYYPRKEMVDQIWQFMYAFNREDTDIYDCILVDTAPSIEGAPGQQGISMNNSFYHILRNLHREHGDMKLGYVRYNDVIYSSVPYIDGVGFFSWSVDSASDRMHSFVCHPFDGGNRKTVEFIPTEQREPEDLFAFLPKLTKALPFPPVPTEKFAVKLFFNNGECRKYVLPISEEDSEQDVLSYMDHVFSDGIWASVSVVPHHESKYMGYPECGPAITFKNEFFIAGTRCYLESEPYSEPVPTEKVICFYEGRQIRKLWEWNVNALYVDDETGLLKVLLSGDAFNWFGKSVFASVEGKRMTSLNFDITESFKEGLARVAINGYGYGFVDKALNFVIPMQYDEAEDFRDGRAKVRSSSKWSYIDKTGCKLEISGKGNQGHYQEVGDFFEGMCRVSVLKLRQFDLAYHSDYDYIAGIWGFVDETGEEVIPPQYIYAYDFADGIAIVARGKWTIDPKWDNKYSQGRYWTEEELWGGIDKNGNEVIPCVFDEIKTFNDCTEAYKAHIGGWPDGRWGVIDRHGNWLVKPIFKDISYEYCDGLFAFSAEEKDENLDDGLLGIYDVRQQKVMFEPQFLDVGFQSNGDIEVDVFDRELGRKVTRILDRAGKERFKSVYSSIYTWKNPYEVVIRDKEGERHGLIDQNGHVILPCIYQASWDGIFHKQKRILFEKNGKKGIMDYDGNIIIPAIYHEIRSFREPLLIVSVGDKESHQEGLTTHDGKMILPAKYKRIGWCSDHKHFFTCSDGYCEMYCLD